MGPASGWLSVGGPWSVCWSTSLLSWWLRLDAVGFDRRFLSVPVGLAIRSSAQVAAQQPRSALTSHPISAGSPRAGVRVPELGQQLTWLVVSGRLAEGDELPPVRHLAEQLGINLHTVRSAYRQLAADGLLSVAMGRRAIRGRPYVEYFRAPGQLRSAGFRVRWSVILAS
jgi:hypothetical protein